MGRGRRNIRASGRNRLVARAPASALNDLQALVSATGRPHALPTGLGPECWFEEECYITEWWNDGSDGAVSVALACVPVGGITRWHALTGTAERYVILAGCGRAEIGQAPPIDVRPGDVVLIEPGEAQRIANTGDEALVFLAVCTPRLLEGTDRGAPEDTGT